MKNGKVEGSEYKVGVFKWVFKLKQHTPMIHFQSADRGVCLRATEVKPKFDRFLLAKGGLSEKQKEQWFFKSDSGELSSKIKMKFKAIGDVTESAQINPLYFGNMGIKEQENRKKTIFLKDGVEGTIICFDSEFLNVIKKYIPIFFLLHNFGTRQNKGFGSFSITGDGYIKNILEVIQTYEPDAYYLDYQKIGRIGCNQRLDDIGLLYGLMKGGINNIGQKKEPYESALFRYYMEKGITNEKKVIKNVLFNGGHWEAFTNQYYVRSVLGITDQFLYPAQKVKVSVKNDKIGRYQSPVYFKVTDGYTFLYLRKMPGDMQNAEFTFSISGRGRCTLKVPEFEIEDFMDWFAKDFNNKNKICDNDGKPVRGSLKRKDSGKFERIEYLMLRRCKG